MDVIVAPDPAAAAREAASMLVRWIRAAVRARHVAHIAFSGGATPALMLSELSAFDVPWQLVHAWQVDERVAPDADPPRNANLLEALPHVRVMAVTATDLRAAARRYAAALPDRLDVVHLGIGDDGHTASWPPGDDVVDSTRAVEVVGPFNGHRRMTLTPIPVNAARRRLVLATGAAKAAVVSRWVLGESDLPVQRVRRTGTTVVLDAAAASHLAPDR